MTKTPMAGPGLAESIPFPAPAWALVAREFRAEALKILPPPPPPLLFEPPFRLIRFVKSIILNILQIYRIN